MNKRYFIVAIIIILIGAAFLIPRPNPQTVDEEIKDFASCQQAGGTIVDGEPVKCVAPDGREFEEAEHAQPDVVIDMPEYGALVTSPLRVSGKARGNWYFEANLPVTLKDQNGKVLAQKGFQALGEWMTTDYVPFDDVLTFPTPDTEFGVLVVEKDNPSGLPEFDSSVAIPVRFR